MSRLEDRYEKDRELRDAARAVLIADVEHARTNLTPNAIAGRVTSRIGDGAKDVMEVAKEKSGDNIGFIAALIGAVILWLGREPIWGAIEHLFDENEAVDDTDDKTAGEAASEPITQSEDNGGIQLDASASQQRAPSGDHDEQ